MKINLTLSETHYLLKLVMSDVKRMDDLMDHALAHGTEIYISNHATADRVNHLLMKNINAES